MKTECAMRHATRFVGLRMRHATAEHGDGDLAVLIPAPVYSVDGGMKLTDEQKDEVDSLLDELAEAGRGSRPLKDPRLFGNYVVAYTSTRRAPNERGQRECP